MNDFTNEQDLIQKHLDGLTSEQEAKTLSERIVADSDFRQLYLKSAELHGALADETLMLPPSCLVDFPSAGEASRKSRKLSTKMARPSQIAAALVGGLMLGLLGMGMVKAFQMPESVERIVEVTDGDFEELEVGMLPLGFPSTYGHWSGDPAEVVVLDEGNQWLRFVETANVTGNPNGLAVGCNVFQLIDLTALQKQHGLSGSETQLTLQLSAKFKREASSLDEELPHARVRCTIQLYDAEPGSIGENWPAVREEAVAMGGKGLKLRPGRVRELTTSCVLAPEARLALISVDVGSGTGSKAPVKLGGFFVDDVQLTLIEQPKLPTRHAKK